MSGIILAMKLSETHFIQQYSSLITPDVISTRALSAILELSERTPAYEFRPNLCLAEYHRISFLANNKSTLVCFQGTEFAPYYYHPATTRMEVCINTSLPLLCIASGNIKNYTCHSDVVVGGGVLKNSRLTVSYTSTSITSIQYGGNELLFSPVLLATTAIEKEENRCCYGIVDFGNMSMEMDAFVPRLWIKSTSSEDYTFNLRKIFTYYYDGTRSYDLYDGLSRSFTTNILALYGEGVTLAFIGRSLNVSLRVFTNRIRIILTGVNKLELFMCPLNYSCALCEERLFSVKDVKVNAPMSMDVIPTETLEEFSARRYEEIKQALGIVGYEFNMTLANYSFGRKVPHYTNVWVRRLPVMVLYEDGKLKLENCTLSMWR